MKSAEQWVKDTLDYSKLEVPLCEDLSPTIVKQIQLDAYKAGMTRAADISMSMPIHFGSGAVTKDAINKAILIERDSLKEIPLT